MCDGLKFQAWQADCIRRLTALDKVELALIVVNDAPARQPASRLTKLKNWLFRKNQLWHLLTFMLDPKANREEDLTRILAGAPLLRCRVTTRGKYSQYFSESDIQTIRAYNLDFLLRFGFNIIKGDILTSATFGVWSFHHGDEMKYRGVPPCFWEIFQDDPVTGAMLQRLNERLDGGIVLKKGYVNTIKVSYSKSIDNLYFETSAWPSYVCREILNGVADYLNAPASVTKAPIFYEPGNVAMMRFFGKVALNKIHGAVMSFYQPKWNIGIVKRPVTEFLAFPKLRDVEWCGELPKGQYLADPMAVQSDGVTYVLCEKYDYDSKGSIYSVAHDGMRWSGVPEPSLATQTHASYPFLIEKDGDVYCIPETFEARRASAFRALELPHAWAEAVTILNGFSAVDTTLFQYEGSWWLFCTDNDDGPNYKLQLWYAEDMLGPWTPHPKNPVKIDVRSARPAGPPFVHQGVVYRPSQDCSTIYGGAITINKVIALTRASFEEERVAVIRPDSTGPYPNGIHTLCSAGGLCIIDGQRNELKKRLVWRSVRKAAKLVSHVTLKR